MAAIFQDEAPYLREWIEYYKLQGVKHFYLYNNLSKDNYQQVLSPYIARGEVELIEWSQKANNLAEWDKIQVAAYNDALTKAKTKTNWLAIIDIDEFIVPIINSTTIPLKPSKQYEGQLIKLLAPYEKDHHIGGVCIPWVFFGTSHVDRVPDNKLMIEVLVLNGNKAAGGQHKDIWNQGAYKSIVRPKYVVGVASPHYCIYTKKRSHVMLEFEKAQINHYWTKDEYFLHNVKIPRGVEWGRDAGTTLFYANGMHHETPLGRPILMYVANLREKMGLPPN